MQALPARAAVRRVIASDRVQTLSFDDSFELGGLKPQTGCVGYSEVPGYGDEPVEQPSWWGTAGAKLNIAAAVIAGVLIDGLHPVYPWLVDRYYIFPLALVALFVGSGVFYVALARRGGYRLLVPWVILIVVLIGLSGTTAAGDARVHNAYNCWRLSGDNDNEMVACAPGSAPKTGKSNRAGGTSRYCDPVDVSEAVQVTIWRCQQVFNG